jgi:hypothetical protein
VIGIEERGGELKKPRMYIRGSGGSISDSKFQISDLKIRDRSRRFAAALGFGVGIDFQEGPDVMAIVLPVLPP